MTILSPNSRKSSINNQLELVLMMIENK